MCLVNCDNFLGTIARFTGYEDRKPSFFLFAPGRHFHGFTVDMDYLLDHSIPVPAFPERKEKAGNPGGTR